MKCGNESFLVHKKNFIESSVSFNEILYVDPIVNTEQRSFPHYAV